MQQKKIVPTSLFFLAMLYTILLLACYMFSKKELYFPFHALSTPGMLAAPVALMIMDIIVEIFGYKIAKQIFWASMLTQGIFCFICAALAYLPDPNAVPGGTSAIDYHAVLGPLPRIFTSCFIAILLGVWVNSRLLAKWKLLLNGRYFWLRSIGASGIGDGIFVVLSTFLANVGDIPLHLLRRFLVTNYLIELVALIILAPIATICMNLLKRILKDYLTETPRLNFNPFVNKNA